MSENTPSHSATSSATPSTKRRGQLIAIGLFAAALALVGGALALGFIPGLQQPEPVAKLQEGDLPVFDIKRPDALIESAALSQLPKALLEVPLLGELLSEDFVFYYEHNADRLGLVGALRRIIYEHDLTLQDSLIEELLSQPAQVALWRSDDGRLKDFLLVMRRGGAAKMLEPLAKAAAKDSQLQQVAEISVSGETTAVYQLRYGASAKLLFLSHGDYMLVLSNPDLLFQPTIDESAPEVDPGIAKGLADLLNGEEPFAKQFGLTSRGQLKQRITLASNVLAMGYQRLIPSFAGVRFEQSEQGWKSYLALNQIAQQPALDFTAVWQTMPMGPSACVALPVTPGMYDDLIVRLGAEEKAATAFSEHLSGAAGLCWYPQSRLHSPLLVVKLDSPASPELDEQLGKLFDSMIGTSEPGVEGGIFPVESRPEADGRLWQRQVSSRFGQYPASQAADPQTITGPAFFRVSLLRQGNTLVFSLDDQLLEKSRNTLNKRFPPLADVLPQGNLVPAYLAPEGLTELLQRETLESLPSELEPVFRNAAETLLLPRLKTLASKGAYALVLPEGGSPSGPWAWQPLEWKAVQ